MTRERGDARNSRRTTAAISPTSQAFGRIRGGRDTSDWYRFVGIEGASYTFDAEGFGDFDPLLIIRDSEGDVVARGRAGSDGSSSVRAELSDTDFYFLDVQGVNRSSSGRYRVDIRADVPNSILSNISNAAVRSIIHGDSEERPNSSIQNLNLSVLQSALRAARSTFRAAPPVDPVPPPFGVPPIPPVAPVPPVGVLPIPPVAPVPPGGVPAPPAPPPPPSIPSSISGSNSPGGITWHSIFLTAGYNYRINMNAQGSSWDPYLYLARQAGSQYLASNDDSNGTLNSQINYTPATSGEYFVGGGGFSSSSGSYDISFT